MNRNSLDIPFTWFRFLSSTNICKWFALFLPERIQFDENISRIGIENLQVTHGSIWMRKHFMHFISFDEKLTVKHKNTGWTGTWNVWSLKGSAVTLKLCPAKYILWIQLRFSDGSGSALNLINLMTLLQSLIKMVCDSQKGTKKHFYYESRKCGEDIKTLMKPETLRPGLLPLLIEINLDS